MSNYFETNRFETNNSFVSSGSEFPYPQIGQSPISAIDIIFESRQKRSITSIIIDWLSSALLHLLILFPLLFLYVAEQAKRPMDIIASPGLSDELSLTEIFDDSAIELETVEFEVPVAQVETPVAVDELVSYFTDDTATLSVPELSTGFEPVPVSEMSTPLGLSIGSELQGRGKDKGTLIASGGGSEGSEQAVANALEWIAEHQLPDGGWSFSLADCPTCRGRCSWSGTYGQARFGATGMALLPFLGAGNTPIDGKYRETVRRGLIYLMKYGAKTPNGLSFVDTGTMYSHGLCTIALCEAHAMIPADQRSKVPGLKEAATSALKFIEYAQDPIAGGWQYAPRTPGDTSVVGWQVMALKSGQFGRLPVKNETLRQALYFLINVVGNPIGTKYGYTNSGRTTQATNAIGLLCRIYLDWKPSNPDLLDGSDDLLDIGPVWGDPYYNYYATALFHHIGGNRWTQWNRMVRDSLIAQQSTAGHEKGSWWPDTPDGHCIAGGRLYATALNCLTLEVYYRHMPLFQRENQKIDFPLD